MAITKFGLLTLLAMGAAQVSGRDQIQQPAQSPLLKQMTSQGCFSALPSDADSHGSFAFMATGECGNSCTKEKKPVAITFGSTCYCSDKYPAKLSLVDDSLCDEPCPGYAMEACGGMDPKSYSVFNTGLDLAPGYDDGEDNDDDDDASSATEAPFSASASVVSIKVTSATGIPSTTKTEEVSSATASPEETSPVLPVTASQIPPVVNEQTAAATPSASASTVPENASPRLSNPIGNIVKVMMSLL
ncbi:uncharacterized protein FIESC28_11003 [Fusarium coffeatum]|uniref:WSC domain-containing protein n=1 Tax=Fusarium coffeatum TaxID=231269 RepID=A0A366QQN8_9HYPO|nr:uncharacterized protein FIESC28_11003 [Fusarium coffeatum]RBR06608.1 hypothetical protein FIESC28_11003 [Fusarium coffeatum]